MNTPLHDAPPNDNAAPTPRGRQTREKLIDAARGALLAQSYGADAARLAAEAADIRRRFRDFGDLAPGIVQLVVEDANGAILGALEATVRL